MEKQHSTINKQAVFVLWLLCILGSWTMYPYIKHLGVIPIPDASDNYFLWATIQAALFFGVVCLVSYFLVEKTDLRPFAYQPFVERVVFPGLIAGLAVGGAIYFFEKQVFHTSWLASIVHPPFWTAAMASFYGAVNEEVLFRLFLFTLIYFLVSRCVRIYDGNRLSVLWAINIVVAIAFGASHLPIASKLVTPSNWHMFRVIFLNGGAGLVFGWLYWSRGLWTAMLAHAIADFILHMFLI